MRYWILWLCCTFLLAGHAQAAISYSSKPLQIAAGNALISLKAHKTNAPASGFKFNLSEIETMTETDTETGATNDCPMLTNTAQLTVSQLINQLTDSCRYDRLEVPSTSSDAAGIRQPVKVYMRIYIYILQNLDSSDLHFNMQALLQLRYQDARLAFERYTTTKQTQSIMGEASLRELIWQPHIFIANAETTAVLGNTNEKDVLTVIQPNGMVIIGTRIQATLYCWMNFRKFPFDEQTCATVFESWMYNTTILQLYWEPDTPIAFDANLKLTEYNLQTFWHNDTVIVSNLSNMHHGALNGNYSALSFSVLLEREVGYYIIEYFLPSIMIVAISWVTFWLQADQTPARTMLGSTTLLSFITLSLSQENNLSKVSYITLSEVWFLVCTIFIFLSLMEFAFVNTIWRRNNILQLKKKTTKYIVKSTFVPNVKRSKYQKKCNHIMNKYKNIANNSSNVNDAIITIETPIIITDVEYAESVNNHYVSDTQSTASTLNLQESNMKMKVDEQTQTWSTMTPKEVSLWIDHKMRFIFPLAFIIFNAFFWTLVYCL